MIPFKVDQTGKDTELINWSYFKGALERPLTNP